MSFLDRGMNKAIRYLLSDEEGDEADYTLTFRQAKALLQTTEYFRWLARHIVLPPDLSTQSALNQWVSDLETRLMKEVPPVEVCAEIINCIGTDDDVKQAMRDFIMGDEIINQYFQDKILAFNKQIVPTNPIVTTDNLDKLWAQCVQIVEYSNDAIVQLLEVLETQTNNIELIKLSLESIPMFGYILNVVPVDEWLGYADYWLEIIAEQYASGYTDTVPDGLKWRLACEIFCRCKDDLTVTVQRVWDAIANFLSPFTAISWDNASELIETIIGVNDNSEVVALAAFAIMWGSAKLANRFGLSTLTASALSVILKIAENDANDDWMTLCEDCAIDEWEKTFTFTGTSDGWTINVGTQTGSGILNTGSGPYPYTVDISRAVSWGTAQMTRLRISVNSSNATSTGFRGVYFPSSSEPTQSGYLSSSGDYVMDFTFVGAQPPSISAQVSNNPEAGSNIMYSITINGTGIEPTW